MTNPIDSIKSLVYRHWPRTREDHRDWLLKEMPKQSVCAEIGVYKGEFSASILRIVAPQHLHLIDPWKFQASATYEDAWYGGTIGASQAKMDLIYESVTKRFHKETTTGTVIVHRAASVDASAAFSDGYFDWIYIDGDHQYEGVKGDLVAYFPKVKNGGYIAGDDYGTVGWWHNGVTKAVDEFVSHAMVKVVRINNYQFCLKKEVTK